MRNQSLFMYLAKIVTTTLAPRIRFRNNLSGEIVVIFSYYAEVTEITCLVS